MPDAGNSEIILIYLTGTFGMLLLAGAVFFFFVTYQKRLLKKELELNRVKSEHQKEILQNTILAQEKERTRVARDLHDEVGAMLSVVKMNIARIEKKSGNDSKELAVETKIYIDEVIGQVRRISHALLPPSLEKLGLYYALKELVNWIAKSGQFEVECWSNSESTRFEQKKELAVFRIIQELLNNSIKHSEASTVIIKCRFSSGHLAVSICDNGKGFKMNEELNGLGLKNLESRTQILDARFKMKSSPGKGTFALLFFNIET